MASLVACAATLHRIRGRIEGPWDQALAWIDTQLNRLWKARGAFPGLGSALSAFGYEWGFQHGSLLAYEIELAREREGDGHPWALVDAVMDVPAKLGGPVAKLLTDGLRRGWKRLADDRRALLQLLGRCAVSEDQALRMYDATARAKAGIEAKDAELLRNPYLLFERDRRTADPIAYGAVDRGLFPDEAVREQFPVPEPSRIEDPADERRVRALVVSLLERAASEGHTLLPRNWVIQRAREHALQPPCPLGENVLDVCEESFAPVVARAATRAGEPAYQLDRLIECRQIIRREVLGRKKGKPHVGRSRPAWARGRGARCAAAQGSGRARAGGARAAREGGGARAALPLATLRADWRGRDGQDDAATDALLTSRPRRERAAAPRTHGQGPRAPGRTDRHAGCWPDAGSVPHPTAALRRRRPAPTFPSPGRRAVAPTGP